MNGFRPAVGVVGASRFGLCLAEIAARNGNEVVLYTSLSDRAESLKKNRQLPSRLPEVETLHENISFTDDPAELAERSTLILCTMSREYIGRVMDRISAVLDGAHFVVHAIHTLEGPQLQRSSELIRQHTCAIQLGVIAGPAHVQELLAGQPNAAVVGSSFPAVIEAVRRVLGNEYFRIGGDSDLRAVEMAAALGQVVAMGVGMADGANLGSAAHATVFTRGLHEVAKLGTRLGAAERTFFGLAGIGRLVDALSRGEPNYRLGYDIGAGADAAATIADAPGEAMGIRVTGELVAFANRNGEPLPFCSAIDQVLRGEKSVAEAFDVALRANDVWM